MPMQLRGQSRNNLHVLNLLDWRRGGRTEKLTHGAMMTLAPGTGSSFPSMEVGTWASHSSSSPERVEARDEYHEPAWLATLVVILQLAELKLLVGVLGLNGDDKCGVVVGEAFKVGCELFKA